MDLDPKYLFFFISNWYKSVVLFIIVLLGALITSKYTSYSAGIKDGPDRLYLLWTGFTRVRLRVVESSEMA